MDFWLIVLVLYLVTSVMSFGLFFAHYQRTYTMLAVADYMSDLKFSLLCGIVPFVLIVNIIFILQDRNWYKGFKFL